MPIGLAKAPETLPAPAKKLWVDTFNGALGGCEGTQAQRDACAAKIAWSNVKRKYRKMNDQWIEKKSESYHDILLTVTKASMQPDGSVRWQAVASDTNQDRAGERTSVDLFQDWIDRAVYKPKVAFLPDPQMPFLGVSHYPALDGYGQAGATHRMYIDGNTFKADGTFAADTPVGQKLQQAIKSELAMIRKGGEVEKPIRISAGWWDLAHSHEESGYLFTRQSLMDKCPLCQKGQTEDKVYRAGQLDHLAATRVPMNPRTSIELEEKSMSDKITRKQDAESIVGAEEAEEMDARAKLIGKSESEDELPEAMVIRADEDDDEEYETMGAIIKRKRKEMEYSLEDLAEEAGVSTKMVGDVEADKRKPGHRTIKALAKALKMKPETLLERMPKDDEDEMAERSEAEKMGNEMEYDMGMGHGSSKYQPLGGATSMTDAENYIASKEKMEKLYSHWDVFKSVAHNIMVANDEAVPNKVQEMGKAVKDLGNRIDTLKAGLADAFLIQESVAAYDDEDDEGIALEDLVEEDDEAATQYTLFDEVDTMDYQEENDPRDAIDEILADKSLARDEKETAIQAALNEYADTVKAQLDEDHPVPVADAISEALKGAMREVLGPLAEQVGLLAAKVEAQEAKSQTEAPLQQVYMPQQKSYSANTQATPTPVVDQATGHHVSPVIKKPSALTDVIRKSVGL